MLISLRKKTQMSKTFYTNRYLTPLVEIGNLRAKYFSADKGSLNDVVGYETELAKLRAVQLDQYENLHSLIEENTCSCGLMINPELLRDFDAILKVKGHRRHTTQKLASYVTFRGMVHKRLYSQKGENLVDAKWNKIVELHFPKILFAVEGDLNDR